MRPRSSPGGSPPLWLRLPAWPSTTAGRGCPAATSCSPPWTAERFELCLQNPVRLLQEAPAAVLQPRRRGRRSWSARAAELEAQVSADLSRPPADTGLDPGASGRVPVLRVRRARLAAGLLGRPRRAGRRPAQGGLRPRACRWSRSG